MQSNRRTIVRWAEQGKIDKGKIRAALSLAGVFPDEGDWLRFLNILFLFLGATLVSAGVVFFFAYNWNNIGRLFKFGLAEAFILASLFMAWRSGLERFSGKAALTAASIGVGALLALIGQVYQSGADRYELFLSWAVFILPWAFVGRFPVLWIFWIFLVNVTAYLYYQAAGGFFWMLESQASMMLVLFSIDIGALAVWEFCNARGVEWLGQRWAKRLLGSAAAFWLTWGAVFVILDFGHGSWAFLVAWPLWLAGTYAFYRRVSVDLFMLSCAILSAIVVIACATGRFLVETIEDPSAFLFVGLVVIGLSAAGGWWVKQLAAEEDNA
jgi:uncharacterized membrane protein